MVMPHFRLVDDRNAGPNALGILVPPGRQTFVILRPRALPWDLVLTQGALTATFREIFRDEAPRATEAIRLALEAWSGGGQGDVFLQPATAGDHLRCQLGDFHFIACNRLPGQPYRPAVFSAPAEAREAVAALLANLYPTPNAEQEIYFNTRHFEK